MGSMLIIPYMGSARARFVPVKIDDIEIGPVIGDEVQVR